jgi:NIMA (never in mitosis gene a)-related kinase 1/4/5
MQARILARLKHPNVIRHYGSFLEKNCLYIVMEYASGGTLYHVRSKARRLADDRIWKYALQIITALAYIHSLRIIHRDIKTLNLFVDDKDNVKIGAIKIHLQHRVVKNTMARNNGSCQGLDLIQVILALRKLLVGRP